MPYHQKLLDFCLIYTSRQTFPRFGKWFCQNFYFSHMWKCGQGGNLLVVTMKDSRVGTRGTHPPPPCPRRKLPSEGKRPHPVILGFTQCPSFKSSYWKNLHVYDWKQGNGPRHSNSGPGRAAEQPMGYVSKELDVVACGWSVCLRAVVATILLILEATKHHPGRSPPSFPTWTTTW